MQLCQDLLGVAEKLAVHETDAFFKFTTVSDYILITFSYIVVLLCITTHNVQGRSVGLETFLGKSPEIPIK